MSKFLTKLHLPIKMRLMQAEVKYEPNSTQKNIAVLREKYSEPIYKSSSYNLKVLSMMLQ